MKLPPLYAALPYTATDRPAARLASMPSFAPITSAALEAIEGLSEEQEFPAGTTLLVQGVRSRVVYFVRTGVIKLVCTDSMKVSTCLGLRSSGWCCGAVSAYLDLPSGYSVATLSPCVVSHVAVETFLARIASDPQLMRHFLNTLCSELLSVSGAQSQLLSASASQRLDQFMHERRNITPPWSVMDPLPMLKQQELAQLLCISPEHLSRLLHRKPGR